MRGTMAEQVKQLRADVEALKKKITADRAEKADITLKVSKLILASPTPWL